MKDRRFTLRAASISAVAFGLIAVACGGGGDSEPDSSDPTKPGSSTTPDNPFAPPPSDTDGGSTGPSVARDPTTCAEAASSHSYVGCDYWPTISPNSVGSQNFHFVAVVANTGATDATVTVTGPSSFNQQEVVPAGGLKKIPLPWVKDLKGGDWGPGTVPVRPKGAVVQGGAYHLVSSSPVIVYQFNALEFQSGNEFSYSNDASLLLPTTAMRNVYRVAGLHGWTLNVPFVGVSLSPVLSITATSDNTQVKLKLSSTAAIEAAGPIAAAAGGSTVTFTLAKAGDVASLVGQGSDASDFSGSLIESSSPIQVISSVPCIYLPASTGACDHVEETVMPAEAFGKKYVLAAPTGFDGNVGGQVVRLFGNQDGTKLTYLPQKPSGCPDTLNAGEVADCGVVKDSFAVAGDKEFTLQTYLLGSANYPNNPQNMGDPDETNHPAIEQYRKDYIFLAPTDYPVLKADVVAPQGTTLQLDGAAVTEKWEAIGNTTYGVFRLDLTKSGKDGVHKLTASEPVSVQVIGYATNTTFQYPAGLNLNLIAPPPVVK